MTAQRIALVLVVVLAGPLVVPAQAQPQQAELPPASEGARPPLKIGETIWVTDTDGREVKGVVAGFTPMSLEVQGEGGLKMLNMSEIRRIATRDSLKNGFLIGAAVGVYSGVFYTIDAMNPKASFGPKVVFAVSNVAIGVGIYGCLGRWIDKKIEGRRTIYEKPGPSPSIQLGPIVTRTSVSLGGSIRW